MTTEQKAKAYDVALEGIQEILGSGQDTIKMSRLKLRLQGIFPELKESEDERIRKELIEEVKDQIDGIAPPDCRDKEDEKALKQLNKWLAWLERQKPVELTDLRTWKYIVDAVLTEREGIGQYLDSPWTKEVAEKLQKKFGNIEQKPVEWNEEDEVMLNDIDQTLTHYDPDPHSSVSKKAWLKSIKHKIIGE